MNIKNDNTINPSEDLLANEFKNRLLQIINDNVFTTLSPLRKTEIINSLNLELVLIANQKLQNDLKEYQEKLKESENIKESNNETKNEEMSK